ncbi:MAG: FimV/HubP family polar landmark protein, partial [Gammaproteobacteria bacterium]
MEAAGLAADKGLDFDVTEAAATAAERKPEPAPTPEPEPQEAARPAPADEPTGTDYQYPFEDTIAGATGINLQQSDPLAEADFHMAYGLYDQAADLIRKASGREPDRVDLRLKMLDILFVWGKGDEFVTEANALHELGSADASEWSRVAIMGRQIAPAEGLFVEQGGGHAAVDVALTEDAEGKPDIDLAGSSEDLDFDFGGGDLAAEDEAAEALDFDIGATGEMPAPAPWDATQEREVMPDATAEMEIEDLGLDVNLEDLEESTRGPGELDLEGTGMTEIIVRDDDSRFTDSASDTEVLKEFEHSDTGVLDEDSGDTEVLKKASVDEDDETGITEMLETAEDMANDVSGAYSVEELEERKLDEVTREMAQLSEDDSVGTAELEIPDIEAEGDTAEVEALAEAEDGDLDLEDITAALGRDLEQTAEMPMAGATEDADTLIADIFGDEEETRVAPRSGVLGDREDDAAATREMPRIESPDVTLSEVGTKLDLARAYIDMGDPDGARSILDEVMEEGDEGQKGEARDLLDGLG